MNTPHPTALICTAILGFLLFGLGIFISILRLRSKQLSGYPAEPSNLLHRFVRAHGNTAEFAPFLAIIYLYLGTYYPSNYNLNLMVAATLSRILFVVGMLAWSDLSKPNPVRFIGALGTYLFGLALSIQLLVPCFHWFIEVSQG